MPDQPATQTLVSLASRRPRSARRSRTCRRASPRRSEVYPGPASAAHFPERVTTDRSPRVVKIRWTARKFFVDTAENGAFKVAQLSPRYGLRLRAFCSAKETTRFHQRKKLPGSISEMDEYERTILCLQFLSGSLPNFFSEPLENRYHLGICS